MVSLKIQLITTILLISEAYSQLAGCGGGNYQRCGTSCGTSCGSLCGTAAAPSSGGQFIVPAIIKPIMPSCQSAQVCKPSVGSYYPSACYDDDYEDSKLDKVLYLLISNILENRKCSGRKQSCSSGCDLGEGYCGSSYGDDYECGSAYGGGSGGGVYCSPVVYSSGGDCDNGCPEISVFVRSRYDDKIV